MTNERTHALYRFYDATGTLLYVGITADPGARWRQHAHDKPWWHHVANITIETHPTRTAVFDAERAAIIAERPLHNVVHNGHRRATTTPPAPLAGDAAWFAHWGRQAEDMPDDCHDVCVKNGIHSLYFPHLWHHGIAHYTCDHGHSWTCAWGHQQIGAAPENRGKVQERYEVAAP